MGIGDEIMATGQARALWAADTSKRVAFGAPNRPHYHAVFSGLTYIATPDEAKRHPDDVQWCPTRPGNRPYIDYKATVAYARKENPSIRDPKQAMRATRRWFFHRDHWPPPGDLAIEQWAREWAEDVHEKQLGGAEKFYVTDPHLKTQAPLNKDWGFKKYEAVVRLAGLPVVQLMPVMAGRKIHQRAGPGRPLLGAITVTCPSIMHAAALLRRSSGYFGPEGGLHHTAAAVGIQAVVLFGGYIAPDVTGYKNHENIFTAPDGRPCGNRNPCGHCQIAMDAISIERVAKAVRNLTK